MERRFNTRAADIVSEDGRTIKGYASTFDSLYPMYEGYNETIAPVSYTHLTLPTKRIV